MNFFKVKQLLVVGPSGRYYIIDGDDGIRALQCLLCYEFRKINLFVVDATDLTIHTHNILQHLETYHVDVEIASDDELGLEDSNSHIDGPSDVEYDEEEREGFSNQRRRVVSDRLENLKELEKGMTFFDIVEARRIMNYYAMANGYGLKIKKTDPTRARYACRDGCPFRCSISKDKKSSTFRIQTLKPKHDCEPCYKNPRADAKTLAQYFKRKVQNNPKYTVKDMRMELEKNFNLNVTRSKVKRTKLMVLEKLEGSFKDDFNKLEAYGAELKQSNPGTDVAI
ncbi:uncharacterized protein LOC132039862 [Lycium ferocissimum]|uniref:uncharacterized protein LOC132039862 n=1 Tax=Lycium ferocissimum TaxID=112874 RepID=UPI002815AA45|nr:uncharacterized protein LOC132039862 [Lycium ferocissimum]